MKKRTYITIEDGDYLYGIAPLVIEEFPNIDIQIIENTEYYFVLNCIYEDYSDIQDIVSTLSYILIGEGVEKFKITINTDD